MHAEFRVLNFILYAPILFCLSLYTSLLHVTSTLLFCFSSLLAQPVNLEPVLKSNSLKLKLLERRRAAKLKQSMIQWSLRSSDLQKVQKSFLEIFDVVQTSFQNIFVL